MNKSETMIDSHIGMQGWIDYFQAFSAVAILKVTNHCHEERVKAIAWVIVQCDGEPCASQAYTY